MKKTNLLSFLIIYISIFSFSKIKTTISNYDNNINLNIEKSVKSKATSDARYIFTLSKKGILSVFNLIERKIELIQKHCPIVNFTLTKDNRKIIIIYNNKVEIITIESQEIYDCFEHSDEVTNLSLSKNNNTLVTVSICGEIKKYSLKDKKAETIFNYPTCFLDWNRIKKAKVSDNGNLIYFYTDENEISLLHLDSRNFKEENLYYFKNTPKAELSAIRIDANNINNIKLNSNNKYMAVIYNDNKSLKIINLEESSVTKSELEGNIDKITFYNNDTLIIKQNKKLHLINLKSKTKNKTLNFCTEDLIICNDKSLLIECLCTKDINMVDLQNLKYIIKIKKEFNLKQRLLLPKYVTRKNLLTSKQS